MRNEFLDAVPLTYLKGVGDAMAEKLSRLNLFTVQDLLFHLPSRYEDRTTITPISQLQVEQHTTIEGFVQLCEVKFHSRPMMLVTISDGTSKIMLRFFNFFTNMTHQFSVGTRVRAFGEVKRGRFMAEMHHPDYQILDNDETPQLQEYLTPIYPSTEGIKQLTWRKLIPQAIALLEKTPVKEILPAVFNPYPFDLKSALIFLHQPPGDVSIEVLQSGKHPAQQRLIFEELLAHNLALENLRRNSKKLSAFALSETNELTPRFLKNLPFSPTKAQQRVVAEIAKDLSLPHPMLRLVQGDVGSGKTLVAALAALNAIAQGKQVALMAPTEILAEQHYQNFKHWFEPLGIELTWLTGKIKGKTRQKVLESIANKESLMIIGTHALFQEEVNFAELALIIVDEQHRFGVQQRLQLREKGNINGIYPHQLVMTATPIPRTLAMTHYADLDISIIDELPKGRQPITTVAINEDRRAELIARVDNACRVENRQAYWVCSLIDESELIEAQAAEAILEDLQKILPHITMGLVHGRMKPQEKQEVMDEFKNGNLQLLVATTVIEVGVDVPNASLMIIENAERLGLSQLHQLRGRVGRGSTASFCVLMFKSPLGEISRKRLEVMRQTQDGFVIAEEDLKLRGIGDILGTKQTGNVDFKVANLCRDHDIIPEVRQIAQDLFREEPLLAQQLIKRWINPQQDYAQA